MQFFELWSARWELLWSLFFVKMETETKKKYNTQSSIQSIADVQEFAKYLSYEREVAFHPDDDFADYFCHETQEPTFSKSEVKLFNRLMDECFSVCERENKDIYETMGEFHPILNAFNEE